ncbi:MAG: hypothetical protein WCJ02_14375 [bacterium]
MKTAKADYDQLNRRVFIKTALGATAACGVHSPLQSLGAEAGTLPPVRQITRGPKFHWRGYYDKLLFDSTDKLVLANEVDFEGSSPKAEDVLRVGMIDLANGDAWHELGSTHAWNWQQGCMLQWVPGSTSEVAWNDREGDRFVSHILDVKSGKRRTLPHPFYCLSPDGRWGFAPDFRRLNDTRPGYGYAGIADPNKEVLTPDSAGIWRMDMKTGEQKLLFSFADAVKIPFTGRADAAFKPTSKHWFNHLLCNNDGSRLFFLHRWHAPGDKTGFYTRALTMNTDGTDLYVLDPWGATSHFVWRDAKHISAFAWHPSRGERFYVYEDKTDKVEVIGPDVMTSNGHNTYIANTNNEWMLNDTYPDKERFQNPYLYHVPTNRRIPLGHFLSPKEYKGEWRCDTHPSASRDGKQVTIDSPHNGGRQLYLIDIHALL